MGLAVEARDGEKSERAAPCRERRAVKNRIAKVIREVQQKRRRGPAAIRRAFVALALAVAASPAPAYVKCNVWPGLTIDQWRQICAAALQEDYREGSGAGMSWQEYVERMYAIYAQPVAPPPPAAGGMMQCAPVGVGQCFNHWWRTCQRMPGGSGTWWITSSQRC